MAGRGWRPPTCGWWPRRAVDAGSKIPVRVDGHTGLGFTIALVGPDGDLAEADANEETPKATLTAPLRPGRFELVHRTSGKGDGKVTVLARRPLEIRPVALEIRAPARATVGEPIDLGWTGSSGPGHLELWTAAADGRAATRLRPNSGARPPPAPGRRRFSRIAAGRRHR